MNRLKKAINEVSTRTNGDLFIDEHNIYFGINTKETAEKLFESLSSYIFSSKHVLEVEVPKREEKTIMG